MYKEISRECPSVGDFFEKERQLILYYLLGRRLLGIEEEEMMCLWRISGDYISTMYKKAMFEQNGDRIETLRVRLSGAPLSGLQRNFLPHIWIVYTLQVSCN